KLCRSCNEVLHRALLDQLYGVKPSFTYQKARNRLDESLVLIDKRHMRAARNLNEHRTLECRVSLTRRCVGDHVMITIDDERRNLELLESLGEIETRKVSVDVEITFCRPHLIEHVPS